MKLIFKTVLVCLIVGLFSSCAKEEKEMQKQMILLTNPSGWLRVKVEEKSSTGIWVNITDTTAPIDADNLLIFDPWFNWAVDEGALKLEANPQIIASGTWSFVDNMKKIQITDGNLMEIITLTKTDFVTIITTNGVTYRYTYVLGGK